MKYTAEVRFRGEGYSARRVRVEADSPEAAKQKAIEEYSKHIVVTDLYCEDGMTEREEQVRWALREMEEEFGIPATSTSAIISDVATMVGFDLNEHERKIVADWYRRLGFA